MADKYPMISAYAYAFNNPLRYIDPTGMEGEDPSTYKVKEGNTLTQIAKDHKTTVDALLKANPTIKDKDRILTGQTINLPGTSEGANVPSVQAANQNNASSGSAGDGRGSATSVSFGFALVFGISGEWGVVSDETGDSRSYYTVSANFGLGLDLKVNQKEIIPTNGNRFRVDQYEGRGKNLSFGAVFTSEGRGGNTSSNPTLNPLDFGSLYKERSNSFSPLLGIPVGISDAGVLYQMSKTSFFE